MEEHAIVDSSFSAIINAPLRAIDIPGWCFSLPDAEYQECSPPHFAAGSTTAHDGRRMSINVEVIGGTPLVQHYVEVVAEKHHLVLESVTDPFTSSGRTNMQEMWELSVTASRGSDRLDDGRRHSFCGSSQRESRCALLIVPAPTARCAHSQEAGYETN